MTTTTTGGGLNQGSAGSAGSATHPTTGGTSFLMLGLVMLAVALAVRRANAGAARA